MGGIDLDPASSVVANVLVRAEHFYTKKNDGLSLPWHGRVWCNPPYGAGGLTGKWWDKLVVEYDANRVTEALFLANATTETRWFQDALRRGVILLIRSRLSFWRVDAPSQTGFFGSALVYLPLRDAPLDSIHTPLENAPLGPLHFSSVSGVEATALARFVGLAGSLGEIVAAIT